MDFASKMAQIRDLQNELDRMTSSLNLALLESIQTENEKVTPTLCDNPHIALVPYSVIMASPGHILAPDYYIPSAQVEAVRYRINNCVHADQLCKAVKEMLETKRIRMQGGSVLLNETTLRVLRNSELGQFVMADDNKGADD